MTNPKKRCIFCHKWFRPDPRTAHQTCCPAPECRKTRKALTNKSWRIRHPNQDKARAGKKRAWAHGTGYWRNYRRAHPEYRAKDNQRRSTAYKKQNLSANQDLRRKIAVGKLTSIREMTPVSSANQDLMPRRMAGLLDYLLWTWSSANPSPTDLKPAGGP